MATRNSVGDGGLWSASGTWDTPPVAGDTVNITAGDTVTYDINSTDVWGPINVNGLLTFKTDATTKLMIGQNTIAIAAGGELRIGASGAVIGSAYTATIDINSTSDSDRITVAAGGKLTVYGDPAYYGSDDDTTLAADWTTGQTLTVTGDFRTKWAAGHILIIHKNPSVYSNSVTDCALVTIASMAANGSNTDITINESFPTGTFNSGGAVTNTSRNVIFQKNGANTALGQLNTNRPRIADSNTASGNVYLNDVRIVGFDRVLNGGTGASLTRSVLCNGNYLVYATSTTLTSCRLYSFQYAIYGHYGTIIGGSIFCSGTSAIAVYGSYGGTIGADIYSCYYGASTAPACSFSGSIYGCYYGIGTCAECVVSGSVFSCTYGIARTSGSVSGCVYSNTTGFGWCANLIITGKIGYDSGDTSKPNTTDFSAGGAANSPSTGFVTLRGAKHQSTISLSRNSVGTPALWGVACEDYGQTVGAHRTYYGYGDAIRNTSTVRSGGADNSIEVIPQSVCSTTCPIRVFEWTECAVAASSQTRGVYVLGQAWSTFPTASELYFEAEYLSAGSGVAKTTLASTQVLTDNTTWTKLSVTFTPGQVARVRYRLWLKKYASTCGIYADNQLETS